ncbi:MAG: site-2 protease family protein, partial [Actinomycetota bacterium]
HARRRRGPAAAARARLARGGVMGKFTGESLVRALYLGLSMLAGMTVREYVRATVAARLGDPTPRLWGRLSLDPRHWFDPFGSGLLPGLILVLWAAYAGFLPPPVAYPKPAPVDPSYLRRQPRDTILVSVAGPLSNLVLAALAGLVLRVIPLGGSLQLVRFLVAWELVNMSLAVFHVLPIPGLDGARLVGLALPPAARETFRNLDQYLPLFALVVLFLFAGPIQAIVYGIVNAFCNLFSGSACAP